MDILLAFAPFILYVIVERVVGIRAGLVTASVIAAGLLLRDAVSRVRKPKILEIGTFLLFAGLAAYAYFAGAVWSIPAVRLRVDSGLLLIVLISLAVRQPFTLQYAREKVAREFWKTPAFLRTNYIITAVWAVAFAVMVAADLAMLYVPSLPTRFAIIVTILAIYGAFRFTGWYPARKQTASAD
jgi:hypothetical protein